MIRGDVVVTVAGNPVTVRRERLHRIGHLGTADVGRLNVALRSLWDWRINDAPPAPKVVRDQHHLVRSRVEPAVSFCPWRAFLYSVYQMPIRQNARRQRATHAKPRQT